MIASGAEPGSAQVLESGLPGSVAVAAVVARNVGRRRWMSERGLFAASRSSRVAKTQP